MKNIKRVLDMKQNEFTKVTEKIKKLNNPAVENTDKIDPRPNSFQVLQDVEETSPTNALNDTEAYQTRGPSNDNLTRYSKLPEFKDKESRKGRCSTGSTSTKFTTANQLARKFDECIQSEDFQCNTIILHVGTNDLVREEPEKVATDMGIV